ncbi:MAG TPA: LysE family transporter, partial [Azospirillaceae bacterium]|nr:LysE family transporter [Azospirillaceae bacterium]
MTPDPILFAKGLGLGLALAAPVGPIGLLCIRRTLAHGPLAGIAGGLGAAVADGFYGLLAGGGLAALSAWLMSVQTPMRVAGAALLFWLAWGAWRTAVPADRRDAGEGTGAGEAAPGGRLLPAFLSTTALTLANPMTILSFTALFGAMALPAGEAGATAVAVLVGGVFLGSAAWWVALCSGVALA